MLVIIIKDVLKLVIQLMVGADKLNLQIVSIAKTRLWMLYALVLDK